MPTNQLFTDWVASNTITAAKMNQMKNDLAALAGANFTGTLQVNGQTVWHAGNDGPASGLDADTVDGFHATELQAPLVTITSTAADYTLLAADHAAFLRVTGDATITLPAALSVGVWVRVAHQGSALDVVDLVAGAGATLVTRGGATVLERYGMVFCVKVTASVWEAYGEFATVVSS